MKWLSILLILCACGSIKKSTSTYDTIHGVYELEDIMDENAKGKTNKESTMAIDLDKRQISGNDGCNDYSGKIRHFDAAKKELVFSQVVATEMYCDEISNRVGNSFYKIRQFKSEGELLHLLSDKGVTLLTYRKVE